MSQGIHTVPRRLGALIAALLLAAASLVFSASPASAHDELLSTDPAADATLDALPEQLTFTFSAVIATDAGASEVQVTDASGASLADGAPVAADNVLTQPLAGEASGVVTVLWKVVSSDGHPISGQYAFTVTPPATAEPTETPTEEPTEEPTAEPTPTETLITEDPNMAAIDMRPWFIGGAIVFVLLTGAVLYLVISRQRRQKDLDEARWREREAGLRSPDAESDTPTDR